MAYAALVAVGLSFLAVLVLGVYHRQRWSWLVIPTWITGIATLGLFAGAVVTAFYAQKTFASQAEELRNQRVRDRRGQAARVSAWWDQSGPEGDTGTFVRNGSGAPVYQADVTVLDSDGRYGWAKVHALVLPPSPEARFFPIDMPTIDHTQADGHGAVHRVKLCFTDAAGVRWTRDQFGRLNELGSSLRIKTDRMRADAFSQFNDDFKATYGVSIHYEVDPDEYPETKFLSDTSKLGVADALIAPHDWIGSLVGHQTIEPTVISDDQRTGFPSWTLNALTFDHRLYGIPMTVDTVALIRNTDLAPEAPSSFEDLIATAEDLREGGLVTELFAVRVGDKGDPFQLWPIFASAGGHLFDYTAKRGWDPSKIGIASPESVAAFDQLRNLGESGLGVLRRSVASAEAFELFTSRRSAFLITTSDGMLHARRAGVPFIVTAVPPFAGGKPATAFSLVHGLLVARKGVNKAIVHDLFADFLTQPRTMETLSQGIVCPVASQAITTTDSNIRQYQQLCESGLPMPTFPQMEQVWRIVGRAQASAIAGSPAHETAEDAAAKIAALFSASPHRPHRVP